MIRALLALTALLGALFVTPWIPLICAGLLAVRWRAWEIVALGLLIDFLYLPISGGLFGFPFPATVVALVVLWGMEPLRKRLYAVR